MEPPNDQRPYRVQLSHSEPRPKSRLLRVLFWLWLGSLLFAIVKTGTYDFWGIIFFIAIWIGGAGGLLSVFNENGVFLKRPWF